MNAGTMKPQKHQSGEGAVDDAASRATLSKQRYAGVGELLRDVLVREYLRQHPEVSRSQVVTRTVNGKTVCDTIENVAQNAVDKCKWKNRKKEREFLCKQRELSDDRRYQACRTSISQSRKLIDFLFESAFCDFGASDKKKHLNFLERYERLSVDRGHSLREIKEELQSLRNGKPHELNLRSHMVRYFQAFLDQLKCQAAIYKREMSLGDRVRVFAKKFLDSRYESIKTNLQPSTLETVRKIYKLARSKAPAASEPAGDDRRAIEAALVRMEAELERRRAQLQVIQRVVVFLERRLLELRNKGAAAGASDRKRRQCTNPSGERPGTKGAARRVFGRIRRYMTRGIASIAFGNRWCGSVTST